MSRWWDRYPRTPLLHERVCQSYGRPRGLSILPLPGPAVPPPEVVHEMSATFVSGIPGIVFVAEWTGDSEIHRHYVHLNGG